MHTKISYILPINKSRLKGLFLLLLMSAVMVLFIKEFAPAEAEQINQPLANIIQSDKEAQAGLNAIYLPIIKSPRPDTPFGVESLFSMTIPILKQLTGDLQAGWVRMNGRISWADLQPNEGDPIDFDQLQGFEDELRVLAELEAKPIVIVDDYPRWATIDPNSCSALRPDKYDAFAEFTRQLVARYKSLGVSHWELGNEPDVDPILVDLDQVYGCWGKIEDLDFYGGERYGEMIKVVGAAIKQEDPNATVWLGGLLLDRPETTDPTRGKPERFLRGVLEVGAAPYFDILPYHVYPPYINQKIDHDNAIGGDWDAWGGGVVGKARYLRQLMREYGVDKPLFLNEGGFMCQPHNPWCDPEPTAEFYDIQATYAVRAFTRGLAEEVEGFLWYTLHEGWRFTGLMVGSTPRPVYYSYKQLSTQLLGASYNKNQPFYDQNVEAYRFDKNGEQIHILWTIDGEDLTIPVPQNEFLRAYKQNGEELTPTLRGSNYQLQAGYDAIYIIRRR